MRTIQSSLLAFSLLLSTGSVFADSETVHAPDAEVAVILTRTDSVPVDVEKATDAYFEGYVQAYTISGAVDNVLRADIVITISTGIDWQNAT